MFINYLKTAIRNIRKNKVFSLINIMGLALGLTCSLLILLWVNDEYKVDKFHKNGSQLYSIYEKQYRTGRIDGFYGSPGVLADEMKRVLPEVQYATDYAWNNLSTFEANNKIIKENGNNAGPDFFKMFSYPLIEGNVSTALQAPGEIAISKKMAIEFFGSPAQAIGKAIRYENNTEFKITAVFDDLPENSSIQFDYLLTWKYFLAHNDWANQWGNNGPQCFVMLAKGTDPVAFEKKIERFLDTYNKEQTPYSYVRLGMKKYGDEYLYSNFKNGIPSGGGIQYVKLFSVVAIFILLIACINFMNLTTARAVKRAKEIGIRKVVGAVRFALIKQFIGEAFLIVTLAVMISLLLVVLILPQFNHLTAKKIHIPLDNSTFWLGIFALLVVTGFISGSYPALYLSSLKPVRILKGALKFSSNTLWFRKSLVVFQFMLSIILIIGTIVVSRQVNYIQTTNLGYDRGNLVFIPLEGDLISKYEIFKEEGIHVNGVTEISRITDVPTEIDNGTGGIQWPGKDPNSDIQFTQTAIGYDFTKTMRVQMEMGRDFSKDFASDSVGYIVNETALKVIGYKDPLGKPITQWGKKGTIIGVMKDFHFASLRFQINPLILRLGEMYPWGTALVRTAPGQTRAAITSLEKVCKTLNPKFPFTYKFADEEFAKLYTSEQTVGQLANYFAFLAIFISCLGLLGLVIFTSEQRTREFGIRKVLGASPAILYGLLSKDFLFLVLIAMAIAVPLAWIAMDNWLLDYVYKINLSWWMFAVACATAVLIALLTISVQAIKAAAANPVKSLRSE